MIDIVLGSLLGGAAAVAARLRDVFQQGEAIEAVAGLAYLRVLDVRHDDVPPAARPAHVLAAGDPAAAVADAVAALQASDAHHADGSLLQALRLPDKAAALGGPAVVELLDALTLDAQADAALAAVEDALSAAMTGPGRFRGGDYYTAPRVVDLAVRLLDPAPGQEVYDPTCGTGGLLLGALDHATADGGEAPRLVGQDLNPTAVALSRVRCHLRGAPAEIAFGDVLQVPATGDGHTLRTFDYVVSNPPRGARLDQGALSGDPYGRFPASADHGPHGADAAFLAHAVASLGPAGRAVVTTSPALLQSSRHAPLRRQLLDDDLVEAVVSLPAAFFQHKATNAPPLLVLNRAKPPALAGRTVFVEAETGVVPDHALVDRVVAAATSAKPQRGLSAVVPTAEVAARDADLSPSAYVPLVEVERFMGGRGRRVALAEVAQVLPGQPVPGDRDDEAEPVVKARDVRDRAVALDELDRVAVTGDRDGLVACRPGDVVLPRVAARAAAAVPDDLEGALADQSVVVLRPRPPDPSVTGYLVELFNADLGRALLKTASTWSGPAPRLRPERLAALEVPVPEDAVLALLADVRQAERGLDAQTRRVRGLRDRLFSLDDPDRFDDEVRRLRAEAEVLSRGLGETDSAAYRVRNFYPFPLAYRYRELDGIADVRARYKALLNVAENTLAFLGSLGLALAAAAHALDVKTLDQARALWQGGMTIGDWQTLAYNTAKTLRTHGERTGPAASDYSGVWFKGRGTKTSDFYRTVERVVGLRNDEHHDRGPVTETDYDRDGTALRDALDDLFEGLGWTVAYPLRLVERVDAQWDGGLLAETLRYTGDHPGLQRETVPVPAPLVRGHLYVETGDEAPLSLYPFITVQSCPACKRRETYYVDYWNGPDNRTDLKSFERSGSDHQLAGSAAEARRVSADLATWFARATAETPGGGSASEDPPPAAASPK